MKEYIVNFDTLGMGDIGRVGGKNASLGEMISHLAPLGVEVPEGFATTAMAYDDFLAHEGLAGRIYQALDSLDVEDVNALTECGAGIREWIINTPFPAGLEQAITDAYHAMAQGADGDFSVAVRSSATAEDLPDASFAGQQETFLNVKGLEAVLLAVKKVFASLFNDRAIAYRVHKHFEHRKVSLSAGIQRMVRSDLASSGVVFTLDTESGFRDAVFITSSYGLGELVVQGAVNPDEIYVYKPALDQSRSAILRKNLGSKKIRMAYDEQNAVITVPVEADRQNIFSISEDEAEKLARLAVTIEKHYGQAMDIEWAKDGKNGKIYIVQARPETVQSRATEIERYKLRKKSRVILEGRSIGHKIGVGRARIVQSPKEMDRVRPGDILVSDMTDPDWEPIMKRASAIVTNRGGRTCHAAIVARELGIAAVVGCGDATEKITEGSAITVSCAEGDTGYVYEGTLDYTIDRINFDTMPKVPLKIMMNIANPDRAFSFASLPNEGIGLARIEFIITRMIGVHPKALLEFDRLSEDLKQEIRRRIAGYPDPVSFYIAKLAEGISTLAAAFAPKPVIVRLSDFKSNEYANLFGGEHYEPKEENPMLGFRGASRYISKAFRECFQLECEAIKHVRNAMGLENVWIMVPFVRTVDEARQVIRVLNENGLSRGKDNLKIIMMCEIPSNALLADKFLDYFDGFSIGSNDLTQLTLGIDRDSELIAQRFDERNEAVKALLQMAIYACHKRGKYIGICGQGPSDHPDLAKWLMDQGITSVSLNPDTVVETWMYMAGRHLP
ncbi:MAG: phosphoenolpyruvate synthase [Methylococcaceae bacterium]|nr:phosphoenolpyruvate synthase [Methylococcaceae bacterium]